MVSDLKRLLVLKSTVYVYIITTDKQKKTKRKLKLRDDTLQHHKKKPCKNQQNLQTLHQTEAERF